LARRAGAIGTGAFLLGAAGLLDGRRVTTHWQHAAELAQTCPQARVMADHVFVEDGALYSSAGVTAALDLALRLIEDDHGRELARKVARRLVAALQSSGREAQFGTHLLQQTADEERIRAVQRWILDHPALDLTLKALAGHAAMGVRHFGRLFRRETGMTPAAYVELVRVEAARRLVADSLLPFDHVALRCGFANATIMCRAFRRRTGATPRDFRTRRTSRRTAGGPAATARPHI
jgi:transcriptional regulator GlxA family with amidase domain